MTRVLSVLGAVAGLYLAAMAVTFLVVVRPIEGEISRVRSDRAVLEVQLAYLQDTALHLNARREEQAQVRARQEAVDAEIGEIRRKRLGILLGQDLPASVSVTSLDEAAR